ncbi:unnamed protein product, partial [Tetraodon nigroviridis]
TVELQDIRSAPGSGGDDDDGGEFRSAPGPEDDGGEVRSTPGLDDNGGKDDGAEGCSAPAPDGGDDGVEDRSAPGPEVEGHSAPAPDDSGNGDGAEVCSAPGPGDEGAAESRADPAPDDGDDGGAEDRSAPGPEAEGHSAPAPDVGEDDGAEGRSTPGFAPAPTTEEPKAEPAASTAEEPKAAPLPPRQRRRRGPLRSRPDDDGGEVRSAPSPDGDAAEDRSAPAPNGGGDDRAEACSAPDMRAMDPRAAPPHLPTMSEAQGPQPGELRGVDSPVMELLLLCPTKWAVVHPRVSPVVTALSSLVNTAANHPSEVKTGLGVKSQNCGAKSPEG